MRIHKTLERKVKHILSLCFQKVKTILEYEIEATISLKRMRSPSIFFFSGLVKETSQLQVDISGKPGLAKPLLTQRLRAGVSVQSWRKLTFPCKATECREEIQSCSEIPHKFFSTIQCVYFFGQGLTKGSRLMFRTQDLRRFSLSGLCKRRVSPEREGLLGACSLHASLSLRMP